MNLSKLLSFDSKDPLSTVCDPFRGEFVKSVILRIRKPIFNDAGPFEFSATIEFQNGSTSGKHEIKADSFESLVAKTQAFIAELK